MCTNMQVKAQPVLLMFLRPFRPSSALCCCTPHPLIISPIAHPHRIGRSRKTTHRGGVYYRNCVSLCSCEFIFVLGFGLVGQLMRRRMYRDL